jgi:hypothetical protein
MREDQFPSVDRRFRVRSRVASLASGIFSIWCVFLAPNKCLLLLAVVNLTMIPLIGLRIP